MLPRAVFARGAGGAPKEVKSGVTKIEAQDIQNRLEEAGAEVEVK